MVEWDGQRWSVARSSKARGKNVCEASSGVFGTMAKDVSRRKDVQSRHRFVKLW